MKERVLERNFAECRKIGAATHMGGKVFQCNLKGECLNGMFYRGYWLCKTPLKEEIPKKGENP